MAEESRDEDMIHGLTLDQRETLAAGLDRLPDAPPSRDVWRRIRRQAEAEGLLRKPLVRRVSTWTVGGSIAAALVLAVFLAPGLLQAPEPVYSTEPQDPPSNANAVTALQALMVESRQLERDLRALPERPRVVRAGTALTISELEDRIAAIDYQLNDPQIRMTPEEQEVFWRERVRLMKLLVQLRYAQAQRTAF